MPTPSPPSNIRAFVHWREPTVYAGEEIECIITFRNIAISPGSNTRNDGFRSPNLNGAPTHSRRPSIAPSSAAGSRRASIAQNISQQVRVAPNVRRESGGRGHRPTLSLNVANASARGGLQSAPLQGSTPVSAKVRPGHGRSLSIMSLGSDAPSDGRSPVVPQAVGARPTRGHGRSASMQSAPRSATMRTSPNPNPDFQFPRRPSPLNEAATPPEPTGSAAAPLPLRPARQRPIAASAGNSPHLGHPSNQKSSVRSEGLDVGWKFPASSQVQPRYPTPNGDQSKPRRSPSTMHSFQARGNSPRPAPEHWSGALNSLNPVHRVMSESSPTDGTSRASSEFYSLSNHSDETLTSELPYQNHALSRLLPKPMLSRSSSRRDSPGQVAEPETLMMAYAQTTGSFILDGSLVNGAPFEEVKRRGAQSSGGVVGVERSKSKRSSGMFGGFNWGSINESINGLLGTDENSSIAQMNKVASSKSVPLLSTPQSLLFVNMCLGPGESKSYHYRFHLPRGLPPSHERGRAIKVQYRLRLGVQRPDGSQAVKLIDVPFRVLGSVNGRGEMLGHDLMSPYIFLNDSAFTKSIAPTPGTSGLPFPSFPARETVKMKVPKQGLEDFLRYTERLLEQPIDAAGGLISPTSPLSPTISRKESLADQHPTTAREAIDLAILRSNMMGTNIRPDDAEQQSANRFNIARSGQPVAVLTILRPAYRLGEAVIGTLDFSNLPRANDVPPAAPVYNVIIELESAERVDPSLALRSGTSIQRVTRKTHASSRSNTLFSRAMTFSLSIPSTATPSFETTGVNLQWRLRIEFTTQRVNPETGLSCDENGRVDDLLEEIGRDERGLGLIAKERLWAETFEIGVPLKVYGAAGVEDGFDHQVEGLEV